MSKIKPEIEDSGSASAAASSSSTLSYTLEALKHAISIENIPQVTEILYHNTELVKSLDIYSSSFTSEVSTDIFDLIRKFVGCFYYGYTALMKAIVLYPTKIEEEIKKEGVDLNAQNIYGKTALDFTVGDGNLKIAKLLLENGAKKSINQGVMTKAIERVDLAMVKLLLENAAEESLNLNTAYKDPLFADYGDDDSYIKKTILVEAIRAMRNVCVGQEDTLDEFLSNKLEIIKLLLDNGAKESINLKCGGYTALMSAIDGASDDDKVEQDKLQSYKCKLTKLLLENGADAGIRENYEHKTPLMLAIGYKTWTLKKKMEIFDMVGPANQNPLYMDGKSLFYKAMMGEEDLLSDLAKELVKRQVYQLKNNEGIHEIEATLVNETISLEDKLKYLGKIIELGGEINFTVRKIERAEDFVGFLDILFFKYTIPKEILHIYLDLGNIPILHNSIAKCGMISADKEEEGNAFQQSMINNIETMLSMGYKIKDMITIERGDADSFYAKNCAMYMLEEFLTEKIITLIPFDDPFFKEANEETIEALIECVMANPDLKKLHEDKVPALRKLLEHKIGCASASCSDEGAKAEASASGAATSSVPETPAAASSSDESLKREADDSFKQQGPEKRHCRRD